MRILHQDPHKDTLNKDIPRMNNHTRNKDIPHNNQEDTPNTKSPTPPSPKCNPNKAAPKNTPVNSPSNPRPSNRANSKTASVPVAITWDSVVLVVGVPVSCMPRLVPGLITLA